MIERNTVNIIGAIKSNTYATTGWERSRNAVNVRHRDPSIADNGCTSIGFTWRLTWFGCFKACRDAFVISFAKVQFLHSSNFDLNNVLHEEQHQYQYDNEVILIQLVFVAIYLTSMIVSQTDKSILNDTRLINRLDSRIDVIFSINAITIFNNTVWIFFLSTPKDFCCLTKIAS